MAFLPTPSNLVSQEWVLKLPLLRWWHATELLHVKCYWICPIVKSWAFHLCACKHWPFARANCYETIPSGRVAFTGHRCKCGHALCLPCYCSVLPSSVVHWHWKREYRKSIWFGYIFHKVYKVAGFTLYISSEDLNNMFDVRMFGYSNGDQNTR